jgi:DNA-binding FrmR family transcriptional regulator
MPCTCERHEVATDEQAAMLQDKAAVENLLTTAKIKLVRKHLEECLNDIAYAISKKRNHEEVK